MRSLACFLVFFFSCYSAHRDLHSFPTRRSSDLMATPSPTIFESTRRRGFLPLVLPNRRLPLPRTTGKTMSLSSSTRSEEHTSELQSHSDLVCRLLLEKKNFQAQVDPIMCLDYAP